MWQVEFTDTFAMWWNTLTEGEQDAIDRMVLILEKVGPALGRPAVDTIRGSRHPHMKELRIQHRGQPYRVLFAFDPRRVAILLVGGNKTGDARWYRRMLPLADKLYQEHLQQLHREGLL